MWMNNTYHMTVFTVLVEVVCPLRKVYRDAYDTLESTNLQFSKSALSSPSL